VTDRRELWPQAAQPPPISPTIPYAPQKFQRRQRSRWHRGVTTFGPGVKLAITALYGVWFVWGFMNLFFLLFFPLAFIATYVLIHVWRKDEIDDSGAGLFRRSIQETRGSLARDYQQGHINTARYSCRKCGAPKDLGETRCYRCGRTRWVSPGAAHTICGRCHSPWQTWNHACSNCHASVSHLVQVEAAGPSHEVVVVKQPTPSLPVERHPLSSAWRLAATIALGAGLAGLFLMPDKMGALLFAPYVFIAGLATWGMWRKRNRW